jgi:hypothetical protein
MTSNNTEGVKTSGAQNNYTIVTGLKEGVDTSAFSEAATKKAMSSGVVVVVQRDKDERDDYEKYKVPVNVTGKSTVCSSCSFYGTDRYSTDCKVTCESAAWQIGVEAQLHESARTRLYQSPYKVGHSQSPRSR